LCRPELDSERYDDCSAIPTIELAYVGDLSESTGNSDVKSLGKVADNSELFIRAAIGS